jgi:hypothetical protein
MPSPLQVHLMYYAYRIEHKTPCAWAYGWRTGPGAREMLHREDGHELQVSHLRNASAYRLHIRTRIPTVNSVVYLSFTSHSDTNKKL